MCSHGHTFVACIFINHNLIEQGWASAPPSFDRVMAEATYRDPYRWEMSWSIADPPTLAGSSQYRRVENHVSRAAGMLDDVSLR